jgi:hypothetical protein
MDDVFLRARISDSRSVCISPIPKKTYRETGAKGLGGEFGYFVYEVDESLPHRGIEIIAKAASLEAAMRLFDIITNPEAEAA